MLADYTTCLVKGSAQHVVEVTTTLLARHRVDATFDSASCSWRGLAYTRNRQIDVRAALYAKVGRVDVFVLEFQRRCGCGAGFSTLYRSIYNDLVKNDLVCDSRGVVLGASAALVEPAASSSSSSEFYALPLAVSSKDDQSTVKRVLLDLDDYPDPTGFAPLARLVESPFVDVQREGLCCIANKAEKDVSSRRALAATPGLLDKLFAFSQSVDAECRRLSASVLSQLTKEDEVQSQVASKGYLASFVRSLGAQVEDERANGSSETSMTTLEEKRRVVSTLSNCVAKFRKQIGDAGGKDVFEAIALHAKCAHLRKIGRDMADSFDDASHE